MITAYNKIFDFLKIVSAGPIQSFQSRALKKSVIITLEFNCYMQFGNSLKSLFSFENEVVSMEKVHQFKILDSANLLLVLRIIFYSKFRLKKIFQLFSIRNLEKSNSTKLELFSHISKRELFTANCDPEAF